MELPVDTRRCKTCGNELLACQFSKHCKSTDGLRDQCKDCDKGYREAHKGSIADYQRGYYETNRESLRAYHKGWRARNRSKYHVKEKRPRKRMSEAHRRLAKNLRCRLNRALSNYRHGTRRAGSAVDDLGCSLSEFVQHIETQFERGTTWDNWGKGKGTWQIDHIMPFYAFDLSDRQHCLLVCHYLNQRPLWFDDNMKKWASQPSIFWTPRI